jgi:hypothetical protein
MARSELRGLGELFDLADRHGSIPALLLAPDALPLDPDPDRCWKCNAKPGMEELDGACWGCHYELTR